MWFMDSQCWSADHLVVLNHVLAPPDSLRSCDASAVVNNTQRIRELNDELRQHLLGGLAVTTPGVAALGQQAVELHRSNNIRL